MVRENFYVILELNASLPEKDPVTISDAIQRKQREWSKARIQNPSKADQAAALLELIPDMRKCMSDDDFLNQEAAKARIILAQREKEMFKELDNAIRMISLKGYITESELNKLAKKFKNIDRSKLEQRIKVPHRNDQKKKPQPKSLEKSVVRQIREALDRVDHSSLYDFLGLSRTSSLSVLLAAARTKDTENRKYAKKTSEVTTIGQLAGHCLNLFKSEEGRTSYDTSLVYEGLLPLNENLENAGLDGKIQAVEYDELLKQALTLGLGRDEAVTYIGDYAAKRRWSVEIPGALTADTMKQCGNCGVFNDAKSNNCSHCGLLLCEQPKPVEDLQVKSSGTGLEIRWTPPLVGNVSIYWSEHPPQGQSGQAIASNERTTLGKAIPVLSQGYVNPSLSVQGECWITPVTEVGESATLGRSAIFTSLEGVTKLRSQLSGGRIYLDWNWPHGAKLAVVAWRYDHFPKRADEELISKQTVSLEQYERSGGLCLTQFENRSHYFSVFSMLETATKTFYSSGEQVMLPMGDLAEIFYEVKLKRNLFRKVKSAQLNLWSTKSGVTLPEAVLVSKPGYQPLDKDDGHTIMTLARIHLSSGKAALEIPGQYLQAGHVAKLFLEQSHDTKYCRLLPAAADKLRLG